MIVGGTKINQTKFVKLNNGRIVKKIDEQYIREDIPCGLAACPFCDKNYSKNIQIITDYRLQNVNLN